MNEDQIERIKVTFACMSFRKKGWFFDRDNKNDCWDVETPSGWKTATNGTELCGILESELQTCRP